MSLTIEPYTAKHVDAVVAFNRRLREGGIHNTYFPETHVPPWLPWAEGRSTYHHYFVAAEDGQVRGGYILKHQPFAVAGEVRNIAQFRLPLSEGLVDKRYAALGVRLMLDAARRQPLLYTLGLGGHEEAMTKMLARAGWVIFEVPFFFRVCRPATFLRQIRYLRSTPARRFALDVMALSGLGAIGVRSYQRVKRWRRTRDTARVPEYEVTHWGPWVNGLWEAARGEYSLIAVRDLPTLSLLYPTSDARFIPLRVFDGERTVGWAVVSNVPMQGHAYFGDMRVGSVIDCLALPGYEGAVAAAAVSHLRTFGADVIVGNQSHRAWQHAMVAAGCMDGPSNYLMAVSKPLAKLLAPVDPKNDLGHLTRGDGSGPENLIGVRPLGHPDHQQPTTH